MVDIVECWIDVLPDDDSNTKRDPSVVVMFTISKYEREEEEIPENEKGWMSVMNVRGTFGLTMSPFTFTVPPITEIRLNLYSEEEERVIEHVVRERVPEVE
jgi:hypothetical protein